MAKKEQKSYRVEGWVSTNVVFYITADSPEDAVARIGDGQWDEYDPTEAIGWEPTGDAVLND